MLLLLLHLRLRPTLASIKHATLELEEGWAYARHVEDAGSELDV